IVIFKYFPNAFLTNSGNELVSKVLTSTAEFGDTVTGTVLIIDAMSNRRIHLRAPLDTTAYEVDMAATQAEGLALIRKEAPDVVIIADDLPGLHLRKFCKLLRTKPQTQLTTIVVAVQRENQSARVSALIDGAHDVIDTFADSADLKARLRKFMRIKNRAAAVHSQTPHDHGLAEPITGFDRRANVTLVTKLAADHGSSLLCDLPVEPGLNISHQTPEDVRRTPNEETDVFVLFESKTEDETRDTLAILKSHAASCDSRVLFVTDVTGRGSSPLDLGADDQVPSDITPDELALRITRLTRLKRASETARKSASELGEMAYRDALTGLNNRRALDDYLARTDRVRVEHPGRIAVLIADIDHFKAINDNHGHSAGDEILAQIAKTMQSRLRAGDFIARYGGEEFLIVLPDVSAKDAGAVANRLRDAVARNAIALEDHTHVRATVSIGVAVAAKSDQKTMHALRHAADRALYDAKRNGRNRIELAGACTPHGRAICRAETGS
ncbi:MAG: hypothetical protein DCO97_18455, partial [Marivita sp. XM-24bin2]|uniref:GGDEF domain-containing response regulator n=1 Tax=Marivita sp. XM-24bin2 TaxID=2133951 RepID=UPI000D7B5CA9